MSGDDAVCLFLSQGKQQQCFSVLLVHSFSFFSYRFLGHKDIAEVF